METMRVLYVTAGFPYPLTSGYLRHYHLIRALAGRGHEITLLSMAAATYLPEHGTALEPYTDRILTFPSSRRSGNRIRKAANRFRRLAGASDPSIRRLGEAAQALVGGSRFDVVLFSGKKTAAALGAFSGLPVVADLCDATSSRLRLTIPHAPPGRRVLLRLECAETSRAERAIVGRASRVTFASQRDLDAFVADHGPLPVPATVLPNGVDVDFWRRSSETLGRDVVVFTGAMDYPPNEDAALQLVESVMPLVRRRIPEAKLLVVGRDPSRRLREAAAAGAATVTGFVDDVRPYLEQASVFAAPLRFGAGIQNKVLEAMAMEVPVVATPLAAGGLYADGREPPIRQAETPGALAELLVEALDAARAGAPPAREARRFVTECFSWEASGDRLESLLAEAAATGRGARVAAR
jgi:glycosyltransferase involved in cell wall biosynthesis